MHTEPGASGGRSGGAFGASEPSCHVRDASLDTVSGCMALVPEVSARPADTAPRRRTDRVALHRRPGLVGR